MSEDTFTLAQEQLEKNKHHSPRRTIEPLLQGTLACQHCGYVTRSLGWNRSLVVPGASLLVAYVLMIQLAGCSHAPSVKLAWDPNPESYVAGYNVYRSEQSGVFISTPISGPTLVTRTSFIDSTVQPSRTYYYVVTAVSTDGRESTYSNQVQAIIGP